MPRSFKLRGASSSARRNLTQRQALRSDPLILQSIGKLVDLCPKLLNGTIAKKDYVLFLCAVGKALWHPHDFNLEAVRHSIEKDWEAECGPGAATISFENMCESLFEISDLWCPKIDKFEYVHFLRTLLNRISVIKCFGADGTCEIKVPVSRLQLVTSVAAHEAAQYEDSASRSSLYVDVDPEESARAAVKLQALHRGRSGRRKFESVRQEKAAVKIQAIHRGKITRKQASAGELGPAARTAAPSKEEMGAATALQAQQRRREARKRVAQIKEDKNALSASMSWLEVSDFDPLAVAVKECTAQARVLAPLETISACGQLDVKEELEKRFVEAQNAVTDAINLGADKIEIGNKNYIAKKAFEDIEAAKKQGHSAFWRCIANSYTSTLRPSPPEKSGSSGSPSTLQAPAALYNKRKIKPIRPPLSFKEQLLERYKAVYQNGEKIKASQQAEDASDAESKHKKRRSTRDEEEDTEMTTISRNLSSVVNWLECNTGHSFSKYNSDSYSRSADEASKLGEGPHIVVVTGMSLSGKTTISTLVAEKLQLTLVSCDALEREIDRFLATQGRDDQADGEAKGDDNGEEASNPFAARGEAAASIYAVKKRGEEVEASLRHQYTAGIIANCVEAHRGFVLDNVPSSMEELIAVDKVLESKDLPLTTKWGLTFGSVHAIFLDISSKAVIQRHSGMKVEIATGQVTSAVERASMGLVEGDDDSNGAANVAAEEEDEEATGEEDNEGDDSDKAPRFEAFKPDRKVKSECRMYQRTGSYAANALGLHWESRDAADSRRCVAISVNATQKVSQVIEETVHKLNISEMPFGHWIRPEVSPIRLELPENMGNASHGDKIKWLLTSEVEGIGPRRMTPWKTACPIKTVLTGAYVEGNLACAVSFYGKLYCLESPEVLEEFMKRPKYFLAKTPLPSIPIKTRVCFIFPSNEEAAHVPECVERLATRSNFQCEGTHVSQSIHVRLSLQHKMPNELVGSEVGGPDMESDLTIQSLSSGKGYFISGFPRNAGDLEALKNHGLLPQKIIVVDAAEEEPVFASTAEAEENKDEEGEDSGETTEEGGDVQKGAEGDDDADEGGEDGDAKSTPAIVEMTESEKYAKMTWDVVQAADAAGVQVVKLSTSTSASHFEGILTQNVDPFALSLDDEILLKQGEERTFGETKNFCPVITSMESRLVPGKEEFSSQVLGKTYLMSSKAAKADFDANPGKYIPSSHPKLSSETIFFLGPRGAGMDSVIETLSKELIGSETSCVSLNLSTFLSRFREDFAVKETAKAEAAKKAKAEAEARAQTEDGEHEADVDSKEAAEGETEEAPLPEPTVTDLADAVSKELRRLRGMCTFVFVHGATKDLNLDLMNSLLELREHPSAYVQLAPDKERAVASCMSESFSWSPPTRESRGEGDGEDEEDNGELTVEELQAMREQAESEARSEIEQAFAEDEEINAALSARLEEENISALLPPVSAVSQQRVAKRIQAFVKARLASQRSVFSTAFRLEAEQCEAMLSSGEAQSSKFGTYCPVTIHETQPGYRLVSSTDSAVLLNGKIYFCAGEKEAEKFISNPILYINHSAPIAAHISCALVGPKHSGSEQLACMLAEKMDLVYVTPDSAVAWVRAQGFSTLCKSESFMDETKAIMQLSPYTIATAVSERLRSCECQRRGYILHGFPSCAEHVSLMKIEGFPVPAQFFVLDTPLDVLVKRQLAAYAVLAKGKEELLTTINELEAAEKKVSEGGEEAEEGGDAATGEGNDEDADGEGLDSLSKLREKASALDVEMSYVGFEYFASQYLLWTAERADIITLLSDSFANVFFLPTAGPGKGNASIHSLCRSMMSEISSRLVQQRWHAKMVLMRRGAPIRGTICPRSKLEIEPPLFGGLCPVSWCDEKKTIACNDRHLCVELKASATIVGKARRTCYAFFANEKAMGKFIAKPWQYVSGFARAPVEVTAQRLPVSMRLVSGVNFEPSLSGYCPVTYREGGPDKYNWSTIVKADPCFMAQYGDEVFAFASARQMHKFLQAPTAFSSLELPKKLPPRVEKVNEVIEFQTLLATLELDMADTLQKALVSASQTRIKHPSLSLRETSVKYVSLYLKAHNPANNERKAMKYKERLSQFIEECEIAEYLSKNAPRGGAIVAARTGLEEYTDKAMIFDKLLRSKQSDLVSRFLL